MNAKYVIAEHNYADNRWALCVFKVDDFRIVNKLASVRNLRHADKVTKDSVTDMDGRQYLRFYDNSLLSLSPTNFGR